MPRLPDGWVAAWKPWKLPARLRAKYERPKREGEGTRLPDFVHVTGDEYFRLDVPKRCCYVKCVGPVMKAHAVSGNGLCLACGTTEREIVAADVMPPCVPVSWWGCDPLGHWLRFPMGSVEELDDGTITVDMLIVNDGPYEAVWSGTLEAGIWSSNG